MRPFIIPLLIGWFFGAASGLLFMRFSHMPVMHERHTKHMREKFFKDLQATPEERVKIEAIIQRSRTKIEALFQKTQPEVEAIRHAARAEIRALLTPQQAAIFDQQDVKMEAHFKKRFEQIHDKWH